MEILTQRKNYLKTMKNISYFITERQVLVTIYQLNKTRVQILIGEGQKLEMKPFH